MIIAMTMNGVVRGKTLPVSDGGTTAVLCHRPLSAYRSATDGTGLTVVACGPLSP
jgi:hypothetical protein